MLHLSGETPYQIGQRHGELLREDIALLISEIKGYANQRYSRLLTPFIWRYLFFRSKQLRKLIPEIYLEEMKGIADGSGQDLKWIMAANLIYELGASMDEMIGGCSAFIAPLRNSEKVVIAKTTDLSVPSALINILAKYRKTFIYDCKWLPYKFMTFSWPMCLAGDSLIFGNDSVIGVNDGGMLTKRMNFANTPITIIMRELAERGGSIDSLAKAVQHSRPEKPFTFLITDGSKENSYKIDLGTENYNTYKLENYLINTNFLESEQMRKKYYHIGYQNDRRFTGTMKRYKNIDSKLKDKVKRMEEAVDILKLHTDNFDAYQGSISNTDTLHGFVYSPKDRKLLFTKGNKTPVTLFGKWEVIRLDDKLQHDK